jgi:uncharacterized protein (DUF1501 family)
MRRNAPRLLGLKRLEARAALLGRGNAGLGDGPSDAALPEPDRFDTQALDLVDATAMRRAFDLGRESDRARERYGRNSLGQACLLARRLVEAGSHFVTISNGGWDTHGQNFRQLREQRLPELDRALATLLRDLDERGLLPQTLVVWMGEFGRTPKINGTAGRDHWPGAQSVVFAGGGVRGGQVVGRTDAIGSQPVERPVSPEDLAATVYHALGIDPRSPDTTPIRPSQPMAGGGVPIQELF